MDKKNLVIAGLSVLLLSTATGGYFLLEKEREKNAALEKQFLGLQDREQRYAVEKSISDQLKDIASQQEQVANLQREKAEKQTILAEEKTKEANEERLKAVEARNAAELSEKEARQARDTADKQRLIAETAQKNAEDAKKSADTLARRALGNSLGLQSSNRYNADDDKELAAKLAYLSWYYVKNYGGDVYNPSVYQALSMTSDSKTVVTNPNQTGGISAIKYFDDKSHKIITVSTYGEIFTYEMEQNGSSVKYNGTKIFSDKKYNFRAIYTLTDGNFYALSSTGHILIFKNGQKHSEIELKLVQVANRICIMSGGKKLLIAGKRNLAIFNIEKEEVEKEILTDGYEISYVASNGGFPRIFDTNGKVHDMDGEGNITDGVSPIDDNIVTCAVTSDKYKAYGTQKGDIFWDDGSGNLTRLVGHESKITALKFSGNRLYSASMDRTLRLWVLNSSSHPDPVTLLETDKWILSFTFGKNKNYIWAGDAGGALLEKLVSPDMMAVKVKEKIQCDFTSDEWNDYVGKNIPYMSFYKK